MVSDEEEHAVQQKFVVGLFESKGTAEDACHRLRTEGVPSELISLVVMHDIAPMPAVVSPAIEALAVDPLVVVNVRETFAPFIRNGETAVFVRTAEDADIEQACDTIRQYAPIKIEIIAADEGSPISRRLP
jgi:hypothetical protein